METAGASPLKAGVAVNSRGKDERSATNPRVVQTPLSSLPLRAISIISESLH